MHNTIVYDLQASSTFTYASLRYTSCRIVAFDVFFRVSQVLSAAQEEYEEEGLTW